MPMNLVNWSTLSQTCSGQGDVAPKPVVGTEECLHMPRALNRVLMSTTSYVRNQSFMKFFAETMKRA